MRLDFMHPADQLVLIIGRIYRYGMTTTSGGNLSVMDESGDLWITPGGVDKGSLTKDDMICLKPDGTLIGKHKPSVELPFHKAIYEMRPDIKAIVHAHPPALVGFSILRKLPEIHLIPNIKLICGDITVADYEVPGSPMLGENIAREFKKGFSTILLENHGVVIGSENLVNAFRAFETLEFCARLQVLARKLGTLKPLTDKEIENSRKKNHAKLEEFTPKFHTSEEKAMRRDMIKLIHRSYKQRLFTSGQGTYSAKLSNGDILITPYGKDRKYLSEEDLVLVSKGKKQKGKFPSRSIHLHMDIYKNNPDIFSVLVAHPPHIMAFAVTDSVFDSKIIPESYILLRDVKKIPFGQSFLNPEETSKLICKSTPVLICENDCVIVAGTSLLNAFDRLEVLEYSANAIISSKNLGEIVKISDEEIQKLHKAFNLD